MKHRIGDIGKNKTQENQLNHFSLILENGADNQKQDINQDSKIKKQFIKADDTSMPE